VAVVDPLRRYDVVLVQFDPTVGSEIRKTRPSVIISPDEMNESLRTVIVAPMTTALRSFPSRVGVSFQGKRGEIALDQLRAVDRTRILRRLGKLTEPTTTQLAHALSEIFAR